MKQSLTEQSLRELNKQLEERTAELQKSYSLLEAAMNATVDGLLAVDRQGNVVSANRRFFELWGMPRDRAGGWTKDTMMAFVRPLLVEPDVFAGAIQHLNEHPELESFDVVNLKDGRTFERHSRPQILGDAIVGRVSSYRDITRQEQTEQALRENVERLQLAQQAAHIGAFEWNIQTGVNTWTPELEAMYGLAPGAFPRTQPAWENLVHPDDRAHAVASVREALASGFAVEDQWRVIWPDGSVHWLLGRFQTFHEEVGRPARLTGVNVDVTQRKRAEDQMNLLRDELAHVARFVTLGEIASGLAHELNQPLTAIHLDANSALHLGEGLGSAEFQGCLKRMSEQSFRAGEIIRRMRSFILRNPTSHVSTNLNPLVREVLSMLAADLRQGHVELELDLDDRLPKVDVDGIQIQQVLVNLVRNALEAMTTTPENVHRLVIRSEGIQEGARVSISDTGCGIAPAIAAKLFHPFQTTRSSGLGLGLAICRTLVEAHHGRIEAHAKPEGGTTFSFWLPAAKKTDANDERDRPGE